MTNQQVSTRRFKIQRKINRREMDIARAQYLRWLKEVAPKVLSYALDCLEKGTTMVDTGAHTGYKIKIDRRSGRERRIEEVV